MSLLRNLLALIGLAALIGGGFGYYKLHTTLQQFDPKMPTTYWEIGKKLLTVKDSAAATTWKIPVEEGITAEEVEESMKLIANEHNIANVGELPLYQDIEARTGKPYRFTKIFMFCNSITASHMLDYNDAYSAYLPCRVSLVEDKQSKLWLYSLNMDMMIYGGAPLPPALKKEAEDVKNIILDIMTRAASGDF